MHYNFELFFEVGKNFEKTKNQSIIVQTRDFHSFEFFFFGLENIFVLLYTTIDYYPLMTERYCTQKVSTISCFLLDKIACFEQELNKNTTKKQPFIDQLFENQIIILKSLGKNSN